MLDTVSTKTMSFLFQLFLAYIYGVSFIFILFLEIYLIQATRRLGHKTKVDKEKPKIIVCDTTKDGKIPPLLAVLSHLPHLKIKK